jgi:hypothetical protein
MEKILDYSEMEKQHFDSFDGDNYDGDNYDGDNLYGDYATGQPVMIQQKNKRLIPGSKPAPTNSRITLSITNTGSTQRVIELFGYLRSALLVTEPSRNLIAPLTAFNPFEDRNATNANGLAYFARNGNAIFQTTVTTDLTTVSCAEIPYYHLFKNSGIVQFQVAQLKMEVTTEASLAQQIGMYNYSNFGKIDSDQFSPSAEKTEMAQNPKLITIKLRKTINRGTGLTFTVLNSETLITLYFDIVQVG